MMQVEATIEMVMGTFTSKGGRASPYLPENRHKIAQYESENGANGSGRWKHVLWQPDGSGKCLAFALTYLWGRHLHAPLSSCSLDALQHCRSTEWPSA